MRDCRELPEDSPFRCFLRRRIRIKIPLKIPGSGSRSELPSKSNRVFLGPRAVFRSTEDYDNWLSSFRVILPTNKHAQ